MKKLIISLLMGALTLTVAAQTETKVNDLSFHCQIEGQDITFPCPWSELERLGWSFSIAEEGDKMVLPTLNTILLDDRRVFVISPQKRRVEIFFCNISDKEIPRKESMVLGMIYTSFVSPVTVYDFKLPSGITGGLSTSDSLTATYGKPYNITQNALYYEWRYSKDFSEDGLVFFMATEYAKVVAEGMVIGFGATANKAVERLISEANIAISDEQARELGKKRMYEQDIVSWTKELQLSASDSVRNNPIYISRIKYALAMNNYHLGNLPEAFKWMLQSAEADDSEAAYSLGVMYGNGHGVEQDYKSAVSWYEKAALQGHREAMNNLANCYNEGHGVDENLPEAFKWWLKAAQNRYEPCYSLVAGIYYEGIYGVKKNYKEAAFWYEKAAETGEQEGIYNLSCMYYAGQGVKRNYDKSFELLMQSDESQYYTQQALGEHYYYGRGVEKDVPRAITHFKNYLNLIENEDAETRKALSKEMKAARKIIDKN